MSSKDRNKKTWETERPQIPMPKKSVPKPPVSKPTVSKAARPKPPAPRPPVPKRPLRLSKNPVPKTPDVPAVKHDAEGPRLISAPAKSAAEKTAGTVAPNIVRKDPRSAPPRESLYVTREISRPPSNNETMKRPKIVKVHGTAFELTRDPNLKALASGYSSLIESPASDGHDHPFDVAEANRRIKALERCATDPDKLPNFTKNPMAARSKKPGDPKLAVAIPAYGSDVVSKDTTLQQKQMVKMKMYRKMMTDALRGQAVWRGWGKEAAKNPDIAPREKPKDFESLQEYAKFVMESVNDKAIVKAYNQWKDNEMRGPDSAKKAWKREKWMPMPETREPRSVEWVVGASPNWFERMCEDDVDDGRFASGIVSMGSYPEWDVELLEFLEDYNR